MPSPPCCSTTPNPVISPLLVAPTLLHSWNVLLVLVQWVMRFNGLFYFSFPRCCILICFIFFIWGVFLIIFRTCSTFVEKIKARYPNNLIHPLGRKELEKGDIDLGSKVVSLSLFLLVSSTLFFFQFCGFILVVRNWRKLISHRMVWYFIWLHIVLIF